MMSQKIKKELSDTGEDYKLLSMVPSISLQTSSLDNGFADRRAPKNGSSMHELVCTHHSTCWVVHSANLQEEAAEDEEEEEAEEEEKLEKEEK
jgi:hypothetical protein